MLVVVASAWVGVPGLIVAFGASVGLVVAMNSDNPAWDDVTAAAVVAALLCGIAAALLFAGVRVTGPASGSAA